MKAFQVPALISKSKALNLICIVYILYTFTWLIFRVNEGKYTSPMDAMDFDFCFYLTQSITSKIESFCRVDQGPPLFELHSHNLERLPRSVQRGRYPAGSVWVYTIYICFMYGV